MYGWLRYVSRVVLYTAALFYRLVLFCFCYFPYCLFLPKSKPPQALPPRRHAGARTSAFLRTTPYPTPAPSHSHFSITPYKSDQALLSFRKNQPLLETLPLAAPHTDPIPTSHAILEIKRPEEEAAEVSCMGEESTKTCVLSQEQIHRKTGKKINLPPST